MFDHVPAPAVPRSVTPVLDLRSGEPVEVAAATLLDPLSAAEVAQLRRETRKAHTAGRDVFRCAVCGRTLYLKTRPIEPGRTGGTRALFAHHDSADCPLTDKRALHPDEIDRLRFDGVQEGLRHETLKEGLADRLREDPAFSHVAVERPIRVGESWRRPDVLAMTRDGLVVFEVQLARIQLPTMMARELAYEAAGVRLLWVVDDDALDEDVWLQSFQDLFAARGGRIIALGDREIAQSQDLVAMSELVEVRETECGFALDRESMPLSQAIDRIAPADPALRPPLAGDRYSRRLIAALRAGEGIDEALAALCNLTGLEADVHDAWADGVPQAVAALGTLMTGRKCNASGYQDHETAAILNNFLETRRHRVWAPVLQEAGRVSTGARKMLERGTTAGKLERALAETSDADPTRRWRPFIDHIFPRLRRRPSQDTFRS